MTHSVHFLIMYNKLSQTCCISSQQANSAIPYASADVKMHSDRGEGGGDDGGPGWLRYASECGRMYVDDSTRKQRLVTLLNL